MKYEEYKKILDNGMVEYINSGRSTFYIGNVIKEYIFDYENELLPSDSKKNLSDKAMQAIIARKPLPEGIRLVRCIWHERKVS